MKLDTERMRVERAKLHLSQADVAQMAGTSQNHYSYIESGQKLPGMEILFGISRVLNIPIDELVIEKNPKLNPTQPLPNREQGEETTA